MTRFKQIDGVRVPFTAEEELAHDQIIAEMEPIKKLEAFNMSRKSEYPSIEELVVALYDTDDKAAIEKRRADVKAKYPKPE